MVIRTGGHVEARSPQEDGADWRTVKLDLQRQTLLMRRLIASGMKSACKYPPIRRFLAY